MFNKIQDAKILVRNKGNYRELDLYEFKNEVYAKFGSGYMKIMYGNLTSNASYRWIEFSGIEANYKNSVLIHEQVQNTE